MTRRATVLLGDPKPTAAAHWNKSLRAARLYTDQWCREWVKRKYSTCVTCESKVNLQWAHVLSGKGDAVKWEKLNMTRQCERCNQLHESNPVPLTTWFVRTYGQPALFDLTIKANTIAKRTFSEIMAIGDKYKREASDDGRNGITGISR